MIKFDKSLDNIYDENLFKLKQNLITFEEFWKSLSYYHPFYIRNNTLMTIDSDTIQEEILNYEQSFIINPIKFRLTFDLILRNLQRFKIIFPEIITEIELLEQAPNDFILINDLLQKIIEINKQDKLINNNRNLELLRGNIPNSFIDNWLDDDIIPKLNPARIIN